MSEYPWEYPDEPQEPLDIKEESTDEITAESPRKRQTRMVLWIVAGAFLLSFCSCTSTFALVIGRIQQAKPHIHDTLDTFVERMEEREFDKAHRLIAPEAEEIITVEALTDLGTGSNAGLFRNYTALRVDSISLKRNLYNFNRSQATRSASVQGRVFYDEIDELDPLIGSFEATLFYHDGQWLIAGFHITAPEEKLLDEPEREQA